MQTVLFSVHSATLVIGTNKICVSAVVCTRSRVCCVLVLVLVLQDHTGYMHADMCMKAGQIILK